MARRVAALSKQPIELRRRKRRLDAAEPEPPRRRQAELSANALHVIHGLARDAQQRLLDLAAGAALNRQRMATRVLRRHTLDGLLGLSELSCGAAIGCERSHVENGEQTESKQLGRYLKPRFLRVAVQMIGRRRIFVTACRLRQSADPSLARVAFEQV